jgi:hypothetical protein
MNENSIPNSTRVLQIAIDSTKHTTSYRHMRVPINQWGNRQGLMNSKRSTIWKAFVSEGSLSMFVEPGSQMDQSSNLAPSSSTPSGVLVNDIVV